MRTIVHRRPASERNGRRAAGSIQARHSVADHLEVLKRVRPRSGHDHPVLRTLGNRAVRKSIGPAVRHRQPVHPIVDHRLPQGQRAGLILHPIPTRRCGIGAGGREEYRAVARSINREASTCHNDLYARRVQPATRVITRFGLDSRAGIHSHGAPGPDGDVARERNRAGPLLGIGDQARCRNGLCRRHHGRQHGGH